jgi:hypothetical protein
MNALTTRFALPVIIFLIVATLLALGLLLLTHTHIHIPGTAWDNWP